MTATPAEAPGARDHAGGHAEIRSVLAESRRLFVSIGLFSVFVNLLMLTGPLFMLQLYDRVLTSRSEATLVALVAITTFLFLIMGLLDHARARVLARAGARFQKRLDSRVLGAILTQAAGTPATRSAPATGLRDLEAMQRFASGPGPFAFFDAPWTPVFLFLLFVFHWMLGLLAVCSGVLLLSLAVLNQIRTGKLQAEANRATAEAAHFSERARADGETVKGLGMRSATIARAGTLRDQSLAATIAASDRGGAFTVASRTLRLFLQSMMLGLGAWLAIRGEVTPGVMIAASILLGRALAPIDQAVGQWPLLQQALQARRSLAKLLAQVPEPRQPTPLPTPQARLEADNVVAAPPGTETLAVRGVSFRLDPGQAIGIAGPSASGKSTLVRTLVGVWQPVSGKVTLGDAELNQYGEETLARYIGWLPQEVVLFEGTVAENIARMASDPDPETVVEAARRTGSHEMILALPGGYDFQVAAGGAALSGGQRQRIALARAFFGAPAVVVLDEPDAHLDAAGVMALEGAIADLKARGGAAIIVAHRRTTFAPCDLVLLMEGGRTRPATPWDGSQPRAPGRAAIQPLTPAAQERSRRESAAEPARHRVVRGKAHEPAGESARERGPPDRRPRRTRTRSEQTQGVTDQDAGPAPRNPGID